MIIFLVSVVILILSYFIYGKFVENILDVEKNRPAPVIRLQDDVDFVPLPAWRIFFIQFLNITGLGLIFGAIAGAMFGSAAFLWIVLGSIFSGAVHGYLSGMLSVRQDKLSISEVVGIYLGPKMRHFLRYFTIILLIFVGTVFLRGPAKKNSLIPTPNLDKLASEGIRFTDAYCPVSVCSPSRFALMTGTYPFRSWKKSGVMSNYEPSLMQSGQLTLMQMLQKNGYATTGLGKWHLGASFPTLYGKKLAGYGKFKAENNGANIDLNKPMSDGPLDHGFVHWLGFSCASECWVLEGKKVMGVLQHDFYNVDSAQNKEHLKAIPRDEYLSLITDKSTQFIHQHVAKDGSKPFFLYYSPYVPYIPLAASKDFIGSTDAGPYGDNVHELDFYIGKLLKTLDSLKLAENTIVLFTSDNGSIFSETSGDTDFSNVSNSLSEMDVKVNNPLVHKPSGELRGTKQTTWEGGVRTPFIVKWPGYFPQGAVSKQLFALNDIMAKLASVLNQYLPGNQAVDSYDLLPVFGGQEVGVRPSIVI